MPPVKSRRAEYTESTRDAVLDNAARLFGEQGYGATSLDEVAAAARVTKGAIYHHFTNKAALMTALIDRLERDAHRRLHGRFAELSATSDPATAGLAVIDEFLMMCSDPVYGGLVFREAPIALGWQAWRACEEEYAIVLVEEVLREMQRTGAIPGPVTGTLVTVVFGMLCSSGQLLAETPEEQRPRVRDELRSTYVAFLAGLATGAPDRILPDRQ
ncbi:TetR/AcrR family transcriptional regulator [Pseudonocardia sp. KRD291]|uniref:TetR/AcrR family transcriptional regulator n=1 Tax=Pseudonocardia sp. KRD291 TaxID=2792007 RepID=UPI001C49DD48|nr:TetR/AcrR family transcriptional regulator [Pseudonocardia sp. KRD291]MBW0103755.1 TetR/AcrR family transcriptional regulator [Pseudonocardia sp. KRD291]